MEGEVVRCGEPESSGANDLIEELDDEFPKPIEVNCKSCGQAFISEIELKISGKHGGLDLTYKANCGCRPIQNLIRHTMADLEDPSELQEKLEEIEDSGLNSGEKQ